jgi:hypothetical protein
MIIPLSIAFLYAPKPYAIDSEKITMNKYFGNIVILRNEQKVFRR